MSLFAVHIAQGVLTWPWVAAGYALAAALAFWGGRRIPDAHVPRVALLTAVFFVASLVHVRVGPTSVHLLLNGLVGVILGRYAGVAIPVGLFLQALLIGHGGLDALGVNTCVLAGPAVLGGLVFTGLRRSLFARYAERPTAWRKAGRFALVAGSAAAWVWCLVFSVELLSRYGVLLIQSVSLWEHGSPVADWSEIDFAHLLALQPPMAAAALLAGVACAAVEARLRHDPEFALGLAVGEFTCLLTLALNALVLRGVGADHWQALALAVFVAHLPIAAVEGLVTGFVVAFLARVQPELLERRS